MEIKLRNVILWLIVFIFSTVLYSKQKSELPEKYEKWIKEDVVYIMTPTEKEVFFKLEGDRERDLFIEEFWRHRDPTPGMSRNEFKDEHYRRIKYANKVFGRGTPTQGWRTDRGKYYIALGRPTHVERFESADINPIEIWYYKGNPKLGQVPSFRLLFYQRHGTRKFELYSPIADGPKSLVPFYIRKPEIDPDELPPGLALKLEEVLDVDFMDVLDSNDVTAYSILLINVGLDLAEASLSNFPGKSGPENMLPSETFIGDVETYPYKKVDDDYAYVFLEHKAAVEVSYSVYHIGNQSSVKVIQDPSGLFFVNYIIVPEVLSIDSYADKYFTNLRASLRLTDLVGYTIYQGERNVPLDLKKNELKVLEKSAFQLCDSFPVIPGDYTLTILLENMVTKEFTSVDKNISAPDGKNLEMSPLVLARKVNRDSPFSKSIRAFQVGDLQIYPLVNNTFTTKDTMFLFFQIYGLSRDLQAGGRLEFMFSSEGKAFQTTRKNITEVGKDRDFLEEFPLQNFYAGTYTVEVSLFDQAGQKRYIAREPFSVISESLPGSWISVQSNPPADDPYYAYVLGNQYFNRGDIQQARDELAKAYAKESDLLDYALGYVRVLLALKEPQRVKEILAPFAAAGNEDFRLFNYLGKASKEVGELEEAISFYQKAISQRGNISEILNSIGDCYFKLGNNEQALRAWEKSLEVNPDQENIQKLVEQIRK